MSDVIRREDVKLKVGDKVDFEALGNIEVVAENDNFFAPFIGKFGKNPTPYFMSDDGNILAGNMKLMSRFINGKRIIN